MKVILFLFCSFIAHQVLGQIPLNANRISIPSSIDFKVFTRSYGTIIGIQRGKYNFLDLGFEYHWKKIKVIKPKMYSVGGNLEYNFWNNVIGYKAAFYTRQGRIALTYGLNIMYFTDFDHSRAGFGPAIGFRFLGFHLVNGYNFLFGSKELEGYNTIYLALRYYFPLDNKIKFRKSK